MSHSASRPRNVTGRPLAGLGLALLSLTACTQSPHQVTHRGLSSDGYGFVQNGPTLAPPEHLLQHQAAGSTASVSSSTSPDAIHTASSSTATTQPGSSAPNTPASTTRP